MLTKTEAKELLDVQEKRILDHLKSALMGFSDEFKNPIDLLLREFFPDGAKGKDTKRRASNLILTSGRTPPAGQETEINVPENAIWYPRVVFYTLNTGAAVASRADALDVLATGGNRLALIITVAGWTASLTVTVTWLSHWSSGDFSLISGASSRGTRTLPGFFTLLPGWRLRTNTTGLQAADQFSAMTVLVQERRI